jgi:hypothetical protein
MARTLLLILIPLLLLTGCGQGKGNQGLENVKTDQAAVTVLSNETPFLSFSWIEKGYNGVFSPLNTELGQTDMEIREQLGQPINEGSYEGGMFLEYQDATYFINPEIKKNVAIAINIEKYNLTDVDLKRTLGTPDLSEFNEMDGLWMYVYELDEYELMFEAEGEHAILQYTWLKEKLR